MKNIFLVLGLVFGVTLGASELFAQSNGRKKRDSKKTPPAKVESKRSRKSADDSKGKQERRAEMHSRSDRGQETGRSGPESHPRKLNVPHRSSERMQRHSDSRGDHGRTGRDHGAKYRRGQSESNRRDGRPSTGHRGPQRNVKGGHRGRPSSTREDAAQRRGPGSFSREMRGENSDSPRRPEMGRSRPKADQRGHRRGPSREMERGPQSQRRGRDLKPSHQSERHQGNARRGKPDLEHRGKSVQGRENARSRGKTRSSEKARSGDQRRRKK